MNTNPRERSSLTEAVARVFGWLRNASKRIDKEYVMLPVAGSDPQYRERVYCYELYHHLRTRWDRRFPFSLCGEIDKRNHAHIRGKYLTNIKPDFLVHRLGWMDSTSNLLALEVKAANAKDTYLRTDLRKLTALRRKLTNAEHEPANYHHAILWIYGLPLEYWPDVRSKIFSKSTRDIKTSLIRCFLHEKAGKEATEVFWE